LPPAPSSCAKLRSALGFDQGSVNSLILTINGTTSTPVYVGPQARGLDQINVLLPTSLARSGTVSLSISVTGQSSDTATMAFQYCFDDEGTAG
jgi:uncharacterized protein (TIGR03437 family)